MCGIAGVMTRDGSPPDPALLDRLAAALAHRGPDGQGRLVRGGVALVHTRLAIIDLDTGDQPLFAPGGTALVANGEIYNNPELRAAMAGAPFRTRSDCEPAAFIYERDGDGFADALRGMYAIALHDPRRERLVLARDPFGIKPLYYIQTDTQFIFASEPQALRGAQQEIDPIRRAELLQLKFTTGSETIFPGIHRVLPGETLVIERARIVARSRRAALPAGRPEPVRPAAAVDALERVLLDSVAVHLRADVPYGLFLSGGIEFLGAAGVDDARRRHPHPGADLRLGRRRRGRRKPRGRAAGRADGGGMPPAGHEPAGFLAVRAAHRRRHRRPDRRCRGAADLDARPRRPRGRAEGDAVRRGGRRAVRRLFALSQAARALAVLCPQAAQQGPVR